MSKTSEFQPGTLIKARGREWIVLPETRPDLLKLRPIGGSEEDSTLIYLPLEVTPPEQATFPPPDSQKPGTQASALLLRDALKLKLRAGAGPFRSLGNIALEPRSYQLVPLMMALKLETVRLLIADDVGIGKTIESALIARELLDRGEISQICVICPPHLCEQWQKELLSKFHIPTEIVRTGTAGRLERGLPAGQSIFEVHPFTIVSLDYIKSDRRRDEFLRACPHFVIVEEAHTCVQSGAKLNHQRYKLLKGLAEKKDRHMLFLTATPHSGNEEAFHNLLGLLEPKFQGLQGLPEGEPRKKLREELALHFVQRRRPDLKSEWKDSTVFPDRKSMEDTYTLTGDWGRLFDDVLSYAREMVKRTEGKSQLQQRMNWWAALALLRCISSSPSAASIALRTRLTALENVSEAQQIEEIENLALETVFDGQSNELLTMDESVPAGTVEDSQTNQADKKLIEKLLKQAEQLKGKANDPKLALLFKWLEELLQEGYHPVIFCRYIATAHYVAEQLAQEWSKKKLKIQIDAVTGQLPFEERQEKINALESVLETHIPVLVATDCLSEGINLQKTFNAVIHYDLTWNPTRHEQREGRVDRFGQTSPEVKILTLYGENNPVDGAVLKVILEKAERIRKELGVYIPMPENNNQVMETIMKTVLLKTGSVESGNKQLTINFGEIEEKLENEWISAKEKAKQTQTIFAQQKLKPQEVLAEWQKTLDVLGGTQEVERFVRYAGERLKAPLEKNSRNFYKFPLEYLPNPLQERLENFGFEKKVNLIFQQPAPSNVEFIHRTHPLVSILADYLVEKSLSQEETTLASRCGALYVKEIQDVTTVFILRLRSQIVMESRQDNQFIPQKTLLSEECLSVAIKRIDSEDLFLKESSQIMSYEAVRNMEPEEQSYYIQQSLDQLPRYQKAFERLAQERSNELLKDHTRVREASQIRGTRYQVKPCLPVDIIGVYVFVPA